MNASPRVRGIRPQSAATQHPEMSITLYFPRARPVEEEEEDPSRCRSRPREEFTFLILAR